MKQAGAVRSILRLEALLVALGAVLMYRHCGQNWGVFALYFLLPDLALLSYLIGPRIGALAYNLTHSYLGAVSFLMIGFWCHTSHVFAAGLIWCAHIGFDRALGYGLKYATGFHDTHLGRIGKLTPL